jgi:hypothetical protein
LDNRITSNGIIAGTETILKLRPEKRKLQEFYLEYYFGKPELFPQKESFV